ncbi:MAG: hypothetical protein R3D51_05430 [Hyphomicrobiaceae bacterium]
MVDLIAEPQALIGQGVVEEEPRGSRQEKYGRRAMQCHRFGRQASPVMRYRSGW